MDKCRQQYCVPGSGPNGNGDIDDGTELFSNVSPQPLDPSPNGFKALAQYDLPANGGNGDGVIDAKEQVFPLLRLWVDANHDGICQPGEMHMLGENGCLFFQPGLHVV